MSSDKQTAYSIKILEYLSAANRLRSGHSEISEANTTYSSMEPKHEIQTAQNYYSH